MTYGELVAADVDVLYIATPHPQHRDLALAAIRNGTPVLVEKSFTATLDGAREVVAAAREAGVFCMEAMWTRMQPAVLAARELVAAGEIGEVTSVHADFGAHRVYDPTHRLFAPELGGGAVLDLGVYVISLAQHFLGTPSGVTAAGCALPERHGRERLDAPVVRRRACSGALHHLAGGDGLPGHGRRHPRLDRDLPAVLPPDPSRGAARGRAGEELDAPALGRGYSHEIIHVGECLAGGLTESPLMPLQDTLDVQWVMQEALDQLGVSTAEGVVDLTTR